MKSPMNWVRTTVLLAWCFGFLDGNSRAEEGAGISVRSDVDSSIVIIDGTIVGKSPVTIDSLSSGLHEVRLLHPDLENWFAPVIVDSVNLLPGEDRDLVYRFDRLYNIRSDPSGAEVLVDGKLVGTTPLFMEARDNDSLMMVRKRGFGTSVIDPARAERGVVDVKLEPITSGGGEPLLIEPAERPVLPLILSGASSILAGGFSAYYKVKADEVYQEYLLTGAPAKLAATRKLDNVAGIALGASQIYLALFSYLLLSQ